MKTINFEKLYTDFKSMFDLYIYSDESLEELKKIIFQGFMFLFRFRLVIFKFEVASDSIEYIDYEK